MNQPWIYDPGLAGPPPTPPQCKCGGGGGRKPETGIIYRGSSIVRRSRGTAQCMCRGVGSVYVGALPSTSLFAESIYHYAVWYFQTIYTESCFHVSGIEWQCVLTNFATWNDLEWPAQRVIWSWERYNNSANVSERAVTKATRPSFSPQWHRQNLAVKACGLLTILRPGKRGRILILTYLAGVEIRFIQCYPELEMKHRSTFQHWDERMLFLEIWWKLHWKH